MVERPRREFLRSTAMVSAPPLVGTATATDRSGTRQRGQETVSVSGRARRVDGEPVGGADVIVLGTGIENEPMRFGYEGYGADDDHAGLKTFRGTTDPDGRFSVSASEFGGPRRVIVAYTDDQGREWYSDAHRPGEKFHLTNQRIFAPTPVQIDEKETTTGESFPVYAGTVSAWRTIDPDDRGKQVFRVAVTETAAGVILTGGTDQTYRVNPWELSIDRFADEDDRAWMDHQPLKRGTFAIGVPEQIDGANTAVDYDSASGVRFQEIAEREGADDPKREFLTRWHPTRGPETDTGGFPAFVADTAETKYQTLTEDAISNRIETAQNLGATGQLLGLVPRRAVTVLTTSLTLLNTGRETVLENAASEGESATGGLTGEWFVSDRDIQNTHDIVERLWIEQPGTNWSLSRPTAASVVYEVPVTMPDTGGTGEFLFKGEWSHERIEFVPDELFVENPSGQFGYRISLAARPFKPTTTLPADYVTKSGESRRGSFEIRSPTRVEAGQQFEVTGSVTEASSEQFGGFKVFANGDRVASFGLGAGQTEAIAFDRSFEQAGTQELRVEVRFTNSDLGTNERVGRVRFEITVEG